MTEQQERGATAICKNCGRPIRWASWGGSPGHGGVMTGGFEGWVHGNDDSVCPQPECGGGVCIAQGRHVGAKAVEVVPADRERVLVEALEEVGSDLSGARLEYGQRGDGSWALHDELEKIQDKLYAALASLPPQEPVDG